MWKLSIVDDQGQKTVVNLVRDEYSIGRSDENTIRLTERNVSRRHAILQRTDLGFVLIDPGSSLGSFVNGVRVGREQDLAHRDQLTIGDYRIEVIDEDLETQEQGHRPFSSPPPSSNRLRDRLVVLIGPAQGAEYLLDGERFLIGRGEECDFCIDHASVSRVHAEVRRIDAERFEIVDKASANGLRINGQEMPRALLDSRDVIELGDVVLKFIPQGQVFRADRAEGQRIAALGGLPSPPVASVAQGGMAKRVMAATIGGTLAGVLAFWLYSQLGSAPGRATAPPSRTTVVMAATQPSAPPVTLGQPHLDEARRALDAGDTSGARAALDAIPSADPLRSTSEFAALESDWARATIAAAQAATDTPTRRALLDQVARADGLPSDLREQAFAELAKTNDGSIDLSDLDSAAKRTKTAKKRP